MTHEQRLEQVVLSVFEEQRRRLSAFFARGEAPAEDLLQDTVLRAWDRRRSLDPDGMASPDEIRERARRYLWRVGRNLVIDELRRRRRRRRAVYGATEPSFAPDAAAYVEQADCLRLVREAAARLGSVRVRRCVAMWLDGRHPDDIAHRLRLGDGQVRGLLQRGRAEVVRRVAARLGRPATASGPSDTSRGRAGGDTPRHETTRPSAISRRGS